MRRTGTKIWRDLQDLWSHEESAGDESSKCMGKTDKREVRSLQRLGDRQWLEDCFAASLNVCKYLIDEGAKSWCDAVRS